MCDRVFVRPTEIVRLEVAELEMFGVFFDDSERGYYIADDFAYNGCTPWEEHTERDDYSGPLTYRRAVVMLDEAFLSSDQDWTAYRTARSDLRAHAIANEMAI